MIYKFASRRQLSFIVSAGGRNLLVAFGDRNQAGVSVFMTSDEKVAKAVRRHPMTRRGVIEETTPKNQPAEVTVETKAKTVVAAPSRQPATKPAAKVPANDVKTAGETKEREYDNYTVARERICKEFGIKKELVRNPTALARVAKENGVIIKYKEL